MDDVTEAMRAAMPVGRLWLGALVCLGMFVLCFSDARKKRVVDRLAAWVAAGVK